MYIFSLNIMFQLTRNTKISERILEHDEGTKESDVVLLKKVTKCIKLEVLNEVKKLLKEYIVIAYIDFPKALSSNRAFKESTLGPLAPLASSVPLE